MVSSSIELLISSRVDILVKEGTLEVSTSSLILVERNNPFQCRSGMSKVLGRELQNENHYETFRHFHRKRDSAL